jgi:serine/threonine protein kinase
MSDPTKGQSTGSDETVLRAESSISAASLSGVSGGVEGVSEMPKVLKQRFVLEDKLGSGGMGTVFRAKDLRKVEARDKQPHVAIKLLNSDFHSHPEAFIALEREASKSQTLRHSNIVSIFDFDKDGNVPFITMELLEGRELGDLLKAYPNGLPEEMAWSVVCSVTAGLEHAHSENVVHADFKPGNILVSPENVAKILDFGIARAMRGKQLDGDRAAADTEFDPAQLAALTPPYASREMLNGDNPEPRDDLFSLGVVIYMVFSGHHPYGRLDANDAAAEKMPLERIKHLSRRQWKVLEQCLAYNCQDRPASAAEVLQELTGKPGWHSWGLAAGLATLTVALVATSLSGSKELDQVKDEVRQSTLVEARIHRITEHLEMPAFDENWNRVLFSELQTLETLAPQRSAHGALLARSLQLYGAGVIEAHDGDDVFLLYAAGIRHGPMPLAQTHLTTQLVTQADLMLAEEVSLDWLAKLDVWIEQFETYFLKSADLGVKRLELVDYLGSLIPSLSHSSVVLAEAAYEFYSAHAFDVDEMDTVEGEVSSAVAQKTQDEHICQVAEVAAIVSAQIDETLNVSCLRLDLASIARQLNGIDPGLHKSMQERIR